MRSNPGSSTYRNTLHIDASESFLMTCEEFEELSGAYALDAITPAEREAAQAHLAGCAACTRRVQELRAVVDILPCSVQQVKPPESLKKRILDAIHKENSPYSTISAHAFRENCRVHYSLLTTAGFGRFGRS